MKLEEGNRMIENSTISVRLRDMVHGCCSDGSKGTVIWEEEACDLQPLGAHCRVSTSFLIPIPPLFLSASSCSLLFITMRRLFNRDKPKPEEVSSDLTFANSSEVIPFSLFRSFSLLFTKRAFRTNSRTFRMNGVAKVPLSLKINSPGNRISR